MSSASIGSASGRSFLSRRRNELSLIIAIAVVIGLTTYLSDSYRQFPARNAQEILRQTSLLGICALGAAVVIISGGIDLSIGSIIAFSSTCCTSILYLLAPQIDGEPKTDMLEGWMIAVAFLGTLTASLLVGSFHAWLITSVGLPPFVATLGSLVGLRSLSRLLIEDVTLIATGRENTQIYIYSDEFRFFGKTWWVPLITFLVVGGALALLLNRTVAGRHLYALGGNEQAAKLSGIRTDRLKWLAYCVSALTASIVGILHVSEIASAEPVNDGMGQELSAIAAAVVGGCNLAGGLGTVSGVMLGAMFLRVVIDSVAKNFKQKPDILEGLVVGVLVVLAVAFNELRSKGVLRRAFFPGVLGWLNVFLLTLLSGGVIYLNSQENRLRNGLIASAVTGVILVIKAIQERSGVASHAR
jgi:ribose/xylose/arabinose/galactoside ABC-type transport system permease subunit